MAIEDENQYTPLAARAQKRAFERTQGKNVKTTKYGQYKSWLETTRADIQAKRQAREKAQQEAFKQRIEGERKRYQDLINEAKGQTVDRNNFLVTREYRDTYHPESGESNKAPGNIKSESGSRLARNEGLYEVSREVSGGWRPATPEEQMQSSSEGGGLPFGTHMRTFGEGAAPEIWEDRVTKVKFEKTLEYQKALTAYQNKLSTLQQELSAKEGVWAAELQKATADAQAKITKMKENLQKNKLGSASQEVVQEKVDQALGKAAQVIDSVKDKEQGAENPYTKIKTTAKPKTVLG